MHFDRVLGSTKVLSNGLQDVFQEYEVKEKLLATVTGNASSMVKAVKDLRLKHIPCFAHTLNLAVTDPIKATASLESTREQASEIVNQAVCSNKANDLFQDFHKNLGRKHPKKLIKDVKALWNSTYDILQRPFLP